MKDVVVAVIISDNRVLVEKRRDDDEHSPGQYRFPSGHVEEGEHLEHALKREVLEELGVKVADYKKIHQAFYKGRDSVDRKLHYFIVKIAGELTEDSHLSWFSRKDADKMSFDEDRDLIKYYLR
ncbi:NUDIX domain-containing protein [Candidatus Micrarchaeota archaeon]|nr:NUDIX domain-containing protein [Candidatus Micrarchaeota archaeon]